jgi:hypothetical protein
MTQRAKIIVALLLLNLLVIDYLVGKQVARSLFTSITLRIKFDGGFAFDHLAPLDTSDAVEVLALKNVPMKLRPAGSAQEYVIDGYKVSILPDGIPPGRRSRPVVPPARSGQVDCTTDAQGDWNDNKTPASRNNQLFIPDLADAAARMGTSLKDQLEPAAQIELTGGGTVSVNKLGGCVEYRDKSGSSISNTKHSMASGVEGILFEWPNVARRKVVLDWTPITGGWVPGPKPPLSQTELTPDANGEIVLNVYAYDPSSKVDPTQHPIGHFKDHFDDAFTSPPTDEKRISLWWLASYVNSPGIDCPSGHK